jgi:predicted DsbA family dithiol-disulfide isomerase
MAGRGHLDEMLTVDLYVDIVCPWCFIGSERLERVLAGPAPEGELGPVSLTYHPFMLEPATPPEGIDIPEMLQRKYGVDPRRIWPRAEAQAREAGIELDLSKQRIQYPSAPAHTLLRHAHTKGTHRALARDLFRANFLDARNIADPAVLGDVAAPHGFSVEETARLVTDETQLRLTHRAAEAAARTGIDGVPFFVFDHQFSVGGAQPEAVLREAIARARAAQS